MSAVAGERQADLVPLGGLRRGQRARIDAVQGPPEWVKRLREMGLRDGVEVRMLRQGPTCMIRLGYQTLCVRCNESTRVLVRPLAEAPPTPSAAAVAAIGAVAS
jgi:Fe2+ transport system protein FeoA